MAVNLNLPLTANSRPWEITSGPNNSLWFTQQGTNQIGELDANSVLHEFNIPTANSLPWSIVEGPDGYMYFTEKNASQIGIVNPFSGVIVEEPTPDASSAPEGIIVGPNKTIVFTETGVDYLGFLPVLPTLARRYRQRPHGLDHRRGRQSGRVRGQRRRRLVGKRPNDIPRHGVGGDFAAGRLHLH